MDQVFRGLAGGVLSRAGVFVDQGVEDLHDRNAVAQACGRIDQDNDVAGAGIDVQEAVALEGLELITGAGDQALGGVLDRKSVV